MVENVSNAPNSETESKNESARGFQIFWIGFSDKSKDAAGE